MNVHTSSKYTRPLTSKWLAVVVGLLLWSNSSHALDFDGLDSFQYHGFLNQGFFRSSDNNFYGNSDSHHGTLEFTEIGLNASIRPLNNLGFAIQGIYRRAGQITDEARIDYALIDWTIVNQEDYQIGLRFGRVKNPLGFYNETRDVAFTRPSIFLPLGIYQERSRNLLLSTDGGQFYANGSTPLGDFSLQINAGELDDDLEEIKVAVLSFDSSGHFDTKQAYIGKLEFESNSGATRLAFSYADVRMDYKPGIGDFFPAGDTSFRLMIFSAQQSWENLTLTGEYLRRDNAFTNFKPIFSDFLSTAESYYLQGEYRFSPSFQGIVRYDAYFNNKDDRDGKKAAAALGNPDYNSFTKDSMLGVRWTPSSSWMIQAEYHRMNGVSALSFADNPDRSATKQHWDLFALQVSYRF